jgi:hypothetical protein
MHARMLKVMINTGHGDKKGQGKKQNTRNNVTKRYTGDVKEE